MGRGHVRRKPCSTSRRPCANLSAEEITMSDDPDAILGTIVELAMGIARQCPDCAEPASQIASLAGELRAGSIDRGAVQDALESQMGENDLSDVRVRATAESVMKAARDET
jgi:hypothetical protein